MEQLKLTEESSKQYVSLLKYLENSSLQRPSNYLMPMEIDKCNTVQEIACVISNYLGIQKRIIINEVNANINVAGSITENVQNIYVNLDYDVMENKKIAAGVLCHELMHHVLQKHNIRNYDPYWNEILTDISTAYMGLGLIYLNGLNNKQYKYTTQGITTKTHQYGYIDESSYLYVQKYIENKYPNEEYRRFIYNNSPYCSEIKRKIKNKNKINIINTNIIPWIIIIVFVLCICAN